MQKMMSNLSLENILFIMGGFLIICFIMLIINLISIRKMKKKYKAIIKDMDDKGIRDKLSSYVDLANEIREDYSNTKTKVENLENILNLSVKKVGIVRYNAFKDVGSDLSFSIALLDNNDDGIVFSGLYSRDTTTTYAKPINNGISNYELSDEEIEAIGSAKENFLSKSKS